MMTRQSGEKEKVEKHWDRQKQVGMVSRRTCGEEEVREVGLKFVILIT